MTTPISLQALNIARGAVTAVLAGDDDGFEAMLADLDAEVHEAVTAMLVGMVAAQVMVRAHEKDVEPRLFWRDQIDRSMSGMGF